MTNAKTPRFHSQQISSAPYMGTSDNILCLEISTYSLST